MIVTSSKAERSPSLEVRRRTYVPGALNRAVVCTALALPNCTAPGPLALDHWFVSVGSGRPSSVTDPGRVTGPRAASVWSDPAETTGAELSGSGWGEGNTWMTTSSLPVANPSLAVKRKV